MSTPRFYHWQDTGSPGRSLSGDLLNKLRTILRACLVDGYSGKPGAGWSMVHERSDGFSLTNANRTGIINIIPGDSSVLSFQMLLLETATDISAGLLKGENLRSGTWYQGSSTSQRHMIFYGNDLSSTYASSLVWSMVADENSFCLYTTCSTMEDYNVAALLYGGETLSFGGFPSFVLLGGRLDTTTSPSRFNYPLCNGFTTLRDLSTGLIPSGASPVAAAAEMRVLNDGHADLLTGAVPKLWPRPMTLMAGGKPVGYLRGVVFEPLLLGGGDAFGLQALGLAATPDNRGKLATLGDRHFALVSADKWKGGCCLLSPDPEFWSMP